MQPGRAFSEVSILPRYSGTELIASTGPTGLVAPGEATPNLHYKHVPQDLL